MDKTLETLRLTLGSGPEITGELAVLTPPWPLSPPAQVKQESKIHREAAKLYKAIQKISPAVGCPNGRPSPTTFSFASSRKSPLIYPGLPESRPPVLQASHGLPLPHVHRYVPSNCGRNDSGSRNTVHERPGSQGQRTSVASFPGDGNVTTPTAGRRGNHSYTPRITTRDLLIGTLGS